MVQLCFTWKCIIELLIHINNVSNIYTNVFPLIPSSGEWFHLKKLLECSVFFNIFDNLYIFVSVAPHLRYPYFDVVVGLCGQMIPRAVLAVVMLLVWHHVPGSSKVMTHTKRDTLALQVGGWAWGWRSHPVKLIFVEKFLKSETRWKQQRRDSVNKD